MHKARYFLLAFLFAVVPPAIASDRGTGVPSAGIRLPSVFRAAVIVPDNPPVENAERNDLESFETSLAVAGIRFTELHQAAVDKQALEGYDCVLVPHASAEQLNEGQSAALLQAVENGCGLVLDGESSLAAALGIRLSAAAVSVRKAKDLQFPGITLYWTPVMVKTVASGNFQPLCIDKVSGASMAVRGRRGKGKFVYFSPLFDPDSGKGYTRFPFLIETLSSVFGYTPLAERKTAAMYLDPGSRCFKDYEQLARQWRQRGIQRIYAGGWYDDRDCDYGRLVRACHENGIPVYCWLEPPMISRRFWDEHPAWREKTALLREAHVDWRYLMDLSDPECRAAAFREIGALLERYDWDGVDVAELYFESAEGPKNAKGFTPMNDRVRRGFREQYGFDPVLIFAHSSPHYWKKNETDWKKLAAYRRELCNGLKKDFIEFLAGERRKKKDLDIVITAIDAALAPELEDYIAEDTDALLSLQKEYALTLQVEDEWPYWSGKPERYAALGERYRGVITEQPQLEIDWNVVDCHEEGAGCLPAVKPTGEEVRQVVYNIDLHDVRPVFYAEDTIYGHDFRNITAVLARRTEVTPSGDCQWDVATPNMVTIHTGLRQACFFMDGRRWNAAKGGDVIIPAGRHSLRWDVSGGRPAAVPRLSYISGELKEAVFDDDALTFAYDAACSSCYAVLDRRPESIAIDGQCTECSLLSSRNGFSLKLPAGLHSVKIVTAAAAAGGN